MQTAIIMDRTGSGPATQVFKLPNLFLAMQKLHQTNNDQCNLDLAVWEQIIIE
jgi:hypothetical protein